MMVVLSFFAQNGSSVSFGTEMSSWRPAVPSVEPSGWAYNYVIRLAILFDETKGFIIGNREDIRFEESEPIFCGMRNLTHVHRDTTTLNFPQNFMVYEGRSKFEQPVYWTSNGVFTHFLAKSGTYWWSQPVTIGWKTYRLDMDGLFETSTSAYDNYQVCITKFRTIRTYWDESQGTVWQEQVDHYCSAVECRVTSGRVEYRSLTRQTTDDVDLLTSLQSRPWLAAPNWTYVKIQAVLSPPRGTTNFCWPTTRVLNYGELAAQAYDSMPSFSGNGIAFVGDMKNLAEDARNTADLICQLKHPTPKAIAEIFLQFHYGWKLTVADTKEFAVEFNKSLHNWRRQCRLTAADTFRDLNFSHTRYLHVYFDPGANCEAMFSLATQFDILPTLDNIWDLIPYSFVIDWFLNIGDLASGVSNFYSATQLSKVLCSQTSDRRVRQTQYFAGGTFRQEVLVEYQRLYRPDFYFLPEYHLSPTFTNIPTHVFEAGSLIVSHR